MVRQFSKLRQADKLAELRVCDAEWPPRETLDTLQWSQWKMYSDHSTA